MGGGGGASHWFWHSPHDLLSKMLHFELHENNFLPAGDSLWQRLGSIPMGGPFGAQSADLHTLWGVTTQGKKTRESLTISDAGFPVWVCGRHWFSLAQFRDNVLIASSLSPGTHTTLVQDISSLLSHIWPLKFCATISANRPQPVAEHA